MIYLFTLIISYFLICLLVTLSIYSHLMTNHPEYREAMSGSRIKIIKTLVINWYSMTFKQMPIIIFKFLWSKNG